MINKSNQGWISDKIGGFFGGIVNKATDKLIEHAKQAFKESMDYLFDQKLKPLINPNEKEIPLGFPIKIKNKAQIILCSIVQ